MAQDQLELERKAAARKDAHALDPSPKTILLHIQDNEGFDQRLETALSLARAYRAHIECLHVVPMEAYVAFDSFGGVFVMNDIVKALDERSAALRARIDAKMGREDVSWDYIETNGDPSSHLVSRAALADLIVAGREPRRQEYDGSSIGLLGDLICRSRTPLFIPHDGKSVCDPAGPALIAWDGGYEAANAVRTSIGILGQCSSVHIVQIRQEKANAFPGTRVLEYLSRHGVHAELTVEDVEKAILDDFVPDILATRAMAVGASFVLMGGYSHSRLGEYIFGGVTRMMLSASPVPLLIAH